MVAPIVGGYEYVAAPGPGLGGDNGLAADLDWGWGAPPLLYPWPVSTDLKMRRKKK